jgi:hypothetical protein
MVSSFAVITLSPLAITVSLATLGILFVFGMLVQKEMSVAKTGPGRFKVLGQVILIGSVPLLIAALLVFIINMAQTLR